MLDIFKEFLNTLEREGIEPPTEMVLPRSTFNKMLYFIQEDSRYRTYKTPEAYHERQILLYFSTGDILLTKQEMHEVVK